MTQQWLFPLRGRLHNFSTRIKAPFWLLTVNLTKSVLDYSFVEPWRLAKPNTSFSDEKISSSSYVLFCGGHSDSLRSWRFLLIRASGKRRQSRRIERRSRDSERRSTGPLPSLRAASPRPPTKIFNRT